MRNSLVFYKRNNSKYSISVYDCCEGLGNDFNAYSYPTMYLAIPLKEMDAFFLDKENVKLYLKIITDTFDVEYVMATEDEIKNLSSDDINKQIKDRGELLILKVTSPKKLSNKSFNVPFNFVRYLWYQHYSNIAIIAVNLYKLNLLQDEIDILAIASSYQVEVDRAVLPTKTNAMTGLLYFRDRKEIKNELASCSSFNGVFYKYCVYFDPIVKVKGSFFTTSENVIYAKDTIGKLTGISEIGEVPSYFIKTLKIVIEDYLTMKSNFVNICDLLRQKGYGVSSSSPILLSTSVPSIKINAVSSIGSNVRLEYMIVGNTLENEVEKKPTKVELPF